MDGSSKIMMNDTAKLFRKKLERESSNDFGRAKCLWWCANLYWVIALFGIFFFPNASAIWKDWITLTELDVNNNYDVTFRYGLWVRCGSNDSGGTVCTGHPNIFTFIRAARSIIVTAIIICNVVFVSEIVYHFINKEAKKVAYVYQLLISFSGTIVYASSLYILLDTKDESIIPGKTFLEIMNESDIYSTGISFYLYITGAAFSFIWTIGFIIRAILHRRQRYYDKLGQEIEARLNNKDYL